VDLEAVRKPLLPTAHSTRQSFNPHRVSEWGATEATVKHEWYVVDDSSDISTVAFPTVKAMDTQTDN